MFALPVSFFFCRFQHDSLHPRPTFGIAYFRLSISHSTLTLAGHPASPRLLVLKTVSRYTKSQATGERERKKEGEKRELPQWLTHRLFAEEESGRRRTPSHLKPRLLEEGKQTQ